VGSVAEAPYSRVVRRQLAQGCTVFTSVGLLVWFRTFFRGRGFRRQSTAKNAIMDLVIDPIDITGNVPPQAFGFINGYDTEIPIEPIRRCAEHFLPLALADFDRVCSIHDFCQFFVERSRLEYRRFTFDMNVQHRLVRGFVLLLTGQRDAGLAQIREFCHSTDAEFDDRVLAECIHHAQSLPTA